MPNRTRALASTCRIVVASLLAASLAACAYDAASVLDAPTTDAGTLTAVPPPTQDGGFEVPPIVGTGIEDLPGRWLTCASDLTIREDGTYTQKDLRRGCTTDGTWEDRGDGSFDMVATQASCGGIPDPRRGVRFEFISGGVILLHPAFGGGFTRYVSEDQPHSRWAVDGTPGESGSGVGRSVISVVGNPGWGASGCYWSAEGDCGGAFSCGGSVHYWDVRDGVLRAGLNCSGDCPCGSTLLGSINADRIEGTFRALNCNWSWDGTFTATRIE